MSTILSHDGPSQIVWLQCLGHFGEKSTFWVVVQLRRSRLIKVHSDKKAYFFSSQKPGVMEVTKRQPGLGGRPRSLGAGFGAAACRSTKVALSVPKARERSISWVPLSSLSPSLAACGGCPCSPLPPFPFPGRFCCGGREDG